MLRLLGNRILLSNWIYKLVILFSFIIMFLLTVSSVSMSAEISIWFIASEYIKGPYPSTQQIEDFKMRYPYADIDIGRDPNISWAVLLQNESVLQLIELFKQSLKNDNEKTELNELTIRVKFISWHTNPLERIERCAISEGIDIVQIGSTWTAYLANKGILSDISSLAKSIEGKYTPCLLKSCKIENKYCYYAIPWSLDIRTWFYNQKLFEKADLDPDRALESLAGLDQLCRTLKERFIDKPGFWPICVPTDRKDYSTLHNALPWIWGYGGKLIDVQNKKGNLLDDRVIKGMTEYVNLAAKGYAPLPCRDGCLTLLDAQNKFLEGNVALIFIGPWIKEAILTNRHPEQFENKGSIKAPYGECPTSLIGGSNLAIIESPRTTFEEMISQKLIRFLSLNGGLGIGLPPCKEALKRLITSEADPYLKPFATILLYQEANTYPSLPEWGNIEQIMVNYIARIWERAGEEATRFERDCKDIDIKIIEDIIREEFGNANKEINKVLGVKRGLVPKITLIMVIITCCFLIFAIVMLIKLLLYSLKLNDILKKFYETKDILHRAKVTKGQICSEEDHNRWVVILNRETHRCKKVLTEAERMGRFLYILFRMKGLSKEDEELSFLREIFESSKRIKCSINQYIIIINKKYAAPEDFEEAIISFFVNSLKPIINNMADFLDRYYLDTCLLEEIFDEQKERFNFKYDKNIRALLGTTRIIIARKDLESCLENALSNARDSVTGIPGWEIKIDLDTNGDYLIMKIRDNGKGISKEDLKIFKDGLKGKGRMSGHGLNDICHNLRKWQGDADIRSDGLGLGTEFILRFKTV